MTSLMGVLVKRLLSLFMSHTSFQLMHMLTGASTQLKTISKLISSETSCQRGTVVQNSQDHLTQSHIPSKLLRANLLTSNLRGEDINKAF